MQLQSLSQESFCNPNTLQFSPYTVFLHDLASLATQMAMSHTDHLWMIIAPRLWSFILGTVDQKIAQCSPSPSWAVSAVKAEIPIHRVITRAVNSHREQAQRWPGVLWLSLCPLCSVCEQNAVPQGSQNTNSSVLHREPILYKGYRCKPEAAIATAPPFIRRGTKAGAGKGAWCSDCARVFRSRQFLTVN